MTSHFASQVARSTPFDNTTNGFISSDVQAAIEEIGSSASPGFTWGRSGNAGPNSWLLNESVPSNVTGRIVLVNSPKLSVIHVANEDVGTFTIGVYTHDGNGINLTLRDTLTVTSARSALKTSTVALTFGQQLAIKIESGSAKNIVAGIVLKGSA